MSTSIPIMTRYLNKSGTSGVLGYACAPTTITVEFANGSVYVYGARSPGAAHVAAMKRCAEAGEGLATYISRQLGKSFECRLREARR